LILCKSKKDEQVEMAFSNTARKIGIATYQTILPNKKLLIERLHQIKLPKDN